MKVEKKQWLLWPDVPNIRQNKTLTFFQKEAAMRNNEYQIAVTTDRRKWAKPSLSGLTDFLSQQGQLLLLALELITQSRAAVDELIDVTGRAAIEAVLNLSAQELAGPMPL